MRPLRSRSRSRVGGYRGRRPTRPGTAETRVVGIACGRRRDRNIYLAGFLCRAADNPGEPGVDGGADRGYSGVPGGLRAAALAADQVFVNRSEGRLSTRRSSFDSSSVDRATQHATQHSTPDSTQRVLVEIPEWRLLTVCVGKARDGPFRMFGAIRRNHCGSFYTDQRKLPFGAAGSACARGGLTVAVNFFVARLAQAKHPDFPF